MDINKPIIALCQLSRTVKDNRDNKPTLSNLRDSGAIEQDANLFAKYVEDESLVTFTLILQPGEEYEEE